jgi:hypothetical protein
MRRHYIRAGIAAAAMLALLPILLAPAAEPKLETFTGKVLPLKSVLEKSGIKLDKDANWFALLTEDGKIYPLIKDDGARMFFKDERLLDRPMRLTGKLVPGTHMLQVLQVHSLRKGELYEVYYWCDICAIKRFEKKDCDCCGALMELRETAVKK